MIFTYAKFLFVFTANIYNTESKTWSKLHNQQFLDDEGLMSGYFEGPRLGPDGYFHLILGYHLLVILI